MKDFIQNLQFDMPLEPRRAFFEGRTNGICLFKEMTENEQIHYVDFTSFYLWTNKYCEVPTGYWNSYKRSSDRPITQWLLRPHQVYHFTSYLPLSSRSPVLCSRQTNVPLCTTCAENLRQTPCEHSEEERMLSGTWCSIEIHKALQLGYQMIRLVEVRHFPQK